MLGRAEQKIHVRVAFLDLVDPVLLRDHASANCDDHVGAGFLYFFQLACQRQRLQFSVLSDRAGVEDDEMCVLRAVDPSIPHGNCHAGQMLAVGLVLLTSKGLYADAGLFSKLRGEAVRVSLYCFDAVAVGIKDAFAVFAAIGAGRGGGGVMHDFHICLTIIV